jgi:hypothetical protein
MTPDAARPVVARRFVGQAAACADLGSPLYAALLQRAAADVTAGGVVWRAVEEFAHLPGGALLALRYLGATHRLALAGRAPDLAAHYPSCGGDGDADGAWPALLALTERAHAAGELSPLLTSGVQTNEVGRSAALLGGFLTVARATGLPLRLLEVGSSAGLNLRWDHFCYRGWGPAGSPVDLGDPWVGAARPLLRPDAGMLEISGRRGCDLAPVDPAGEEGRLTLLSFVWPDMARRFRLLDGACRLAGSVPAPVDRASADAWVGEQLASPAGGSATVVYHSVVLQYIEAQARARMLDAIATAGGAATDAAPLAWLRLEPPGRLGPSDFELRLTTWPGGQDRRLAVAHPHGTWVRWDR